MTHDEARKLKQGDLVALTSERPLNEFGASGLKNANRPRSRVPDDTIVRVNTINFGKRPNGTWHVCVYCRGPANDGSDDIIMQVCTPEALRHLTRAEWLEIEGVYA